MRVFVLLVLIAIAPLAAASEPDGHLRLHAEWVQADTGSGPRVLRLSIRSLVPLDEATLTVSAPLDLVVRAVAPSPGVQFGVVPDTQDRHTIRANLPRLDSVVPSTIDFELTLSPGRNGILEFIVEGRDSNGGRIRSAIGIAVSATNPRKSAASSFSPWARLTLPSKT